MPAVTRARCLVICCLAFSAPGCFQFNGGQDSLSSALQVVIDEILMPSGVGEHSLDLDGDTLPDNQLASIYGTALALAVNSPSLQNFDLGLDDETPFLLDLMASDLVDSPAQLRVYLGEDTDGDATDNFSGTETFAIATASSSGVAVDGRIEAGTLHASGSLVMPLVVFDSLLFLPLHRAQIHAEVTDEGMTDGIVAGAIPMDTIQTDVFGVWAEHLGRFLDGSEATEEEKNTLLKTFDTNKDGKIHQQDFVDNVLFSVVVKPDIDTDDDGKPDAMSAGFGFSAVPCKIDFGE